MRKPEDINQEIRQLIDENQEVFERYIELALELLMHKDQGLFLCRYENNDRDVIRLEKFH